ncbi:MAG: c-type cytochrome [Proteobacteria bacterium]|nr:c-type cytochrome [Pseudomonadota bacterium]
MRWAALLLIVLVACPSDDDDTPTPSADDDDSAASDDDDSSAAPDDDDSAAPDDDDDDDDDDTTPPEPPELTTPEQIHGLELYTTYCVGCHGELLEGYGADFAPSLSSPQLLASATDAFLDAAITHGRPGTVMSAWSADYGGPMTPPEIDDVVAYLRAWQTAESVDVHDQVVTGDAEAGDALFSVYCASCHGDAGEGGIGPHLANPWFLHTASDGYIRYAIEQGRDGTMMISWSSTFEDAQVDDLTALLRSWSTPVEDTKVPPFEPDLTQPVIHEGGPSADFADALIEGLYVPVADVAAAYDAGQVMVLLDARPGSDYLVGHITGAVSVPFYRVVDAAPHLPDDVWLVAYCGCPHELSGDVAAQLSALGFPLTAVLDEGWYPWSGDGHPTTTGPGQY